MPEQLVVHHRYRGPESSGNGGYSAGLAAEALGGAVEVTLRMPPPLERALQVCREDGGLVVRDGAAVVAEAKPAPSMVDLAPPRAVTAAEATDAAATYAGHQDHLFPQCFTCGPDRAEGDGLRIFPGPVGDGLLAAPWVPDASLSTVGDEVRVAAIWAALDCPSGWAGELSKARPAVLGRLAVDHRAPVLVDRPYVVIGWPLEDAARKFIAASALLDADGAVVAVARATWVRIDPASWAG